MNEWTKIHHKNLCSHKIIFWLMSCGWPCHGYIKGRRQFFTGEMNSNVSSCYPLFFAIRFLLFFIIQCGKYILVRRCNSLKDICPTVIGFQRFLELWYSNIFFLMPREMGVIMSCYCRYCVVFLALQGFFLFGFTRMWHLIDVGYKSSANKTCWIWFRLSWLYRKKRVKFNQFSRQEAEKKSGQW